MTQYPVICIDPGHGGEARVDGLSDRYTGCIHHGIVEKDYNLAIGTMLHQALQVWPVKCVMTRSHDMRLDLIERGTIATTYGSGLILSLHVNAHSMTGFHGLMCFHQQGSITGHEVASTIARCAPTPLRRGNAVFVAHDDPAKQGDEWLARPENVLRPHSGVAVLVEMGYCTNYSDALALKTSGTQCGIVASCLAGVARWLEVINDAS